MRIILLITGLFLLSSVNAEESKWTFILEGGAVYQTRNDVQIPPTTGTRFSLVDAIGQGPLPYIRFETKYKLDNKQRLRLLIAPLAIEETGQLSVPVNFDGGSFLANTPTTYRYQFNSYRLSYAYRYFEDASSSFDIGFTAKIRDADIALTQGATKSNYPNVGFVPLLHLAAEKRLSPKWRIESDLDAAWSPYGRAFDLGVFAHYKLDNTWDLGAGYRTVEGGADGDRVFSFAWLHYAGLRLQAKF